jgi:hypothetical protein
MNAKSMMELLIEEKIECIELIRKMLIEREIGLITQEIDEIKEINIQISSLQKRQAAVDKLIEKEQMILDGNCFEDFISCITILANHSF